MELAVQLVLSLLDDFLLIFRLYLPIHDLLFDLLEPLYLMVALCKLRDSILVLLLEENFHLLSVHLSVLQFVGLHLGHVNDTGGEGVAKDLIVNISWLLCNREHVSLRHVVLDPEVPVIENAGIIEGVVLWEQVTDEISVLTVLRRVCQVRYHERSLYRVLTHLTDELILIDEGQFCASGVHQNLVDHVIRALAVLHHSVKGHCEKDHHEGKHDRVALVERILLDAIV